MADNKGYIKISRKLFENDFFLEQREFSRFEAWLDLIQLCAFEENNSMLIRGRIVKWGRGQTIASVRYLQQRWGWKSTKKVVCFLELLRSQMMIETDTSQKLQRITLCKYDSYNSSGNSWETERGTVRKQSGNKIKELKEFKKENNLETNVSPAQAPLAGMDLKEKYRTISKGKGAIFKFIKDEKPGFIDPYVDLWNLFSQEYGFPRVEKMSDKRKRKLLIRLKDKYFDFPKILGIAAKSDFILNSTTKWFSFDFLIENDTNYAKVLEGKYQSKQPKGQVNPMIEKLKAAEKRRNND